MLHIQIITIGKTKKLGLQEAIDEYLKRLKGHVQLKVEYLTSNQHLNTRLKSLKGTHIVLDEKGLNLSSPQFSQQLYAIASHKGPKINFIIGGAEGLDEEIKNKNECWSLSPLTLTHQMIRLLLVEQLYRAYEISKGSKYHK